jgi:ABC-type transport system involved in multi-copper enzyme maturation permease subunit
MALPISRQQVIIEKYMAFALISLGIVVLCFIFPFIALVLFKVEVDMGKVFLSVLTIYPGLLILTAITTLISVTVRRKTTAIGVMTGFVIASYFLNFIGNAASETIVASLRGLSIFYYTEGQSVALGTYSPVGSIALLVVSGIIVGLSIVMFERRDIGI